MKGAPFTSSPPQNQDAVLSDMERDGGEGIR